MKAAVILTADHALLPQQAGEINALLNTMATVFSRVELWLFCQDQGTAPDIFPEMPLPLTAIKQIPLARDVKHLPECYLALLSRLWQETPADLLVFAGDTLGGELATRLGYRLQGTSCLQVRACRFTPHGLEVTKPVYGNNLTADFLLPGSPWCLSVAKRPCAPAQMTRYEGISVETLSLHPPPCSWVIKTRTFPDPPDTGLLHADRVLVVGQGADSRKTVTALKEIAEIISAQLGASRPVVMNAWTEMNRLIGASGLVISPKLCITAGVSGAAVFSMGIENSEFIVAINTDKNAPIFKLAHVGIIGDLQTVLDELASLITAQRAKKVQDLEASPKDASSSTTKGETP